MFAIAATKNWDEYVVQAEEVSRGAGFQDLRDRILGLVGPSSSEAAVDIGAGTGLLTLALAPRVNSVCAIDISPRMLDYLAAKAARCQISNVQTVVGSAISLPIADSSIDVVVSNYCLHHLNDADKRRALQEAFRVLRPGGRLVFADMMFGLGVADRRDRRVLAQKVRALISKGPAGVVRLIQNALRILTGQWERPARTDWWERALTETGFTDVQVVALDHEGGIAQARRA